MSRLIIGNLELCSLPELGIHGIEVRVDTGAKTSSLHVDNISKFTQDGALYVGFDIHPDIYDVAKIVHCSSKVVDIRKIKSSNGRVELRYIIQTTLELGDKDWLIEVSLSNRQDMSYWMLLGREAMGDRVYVDPSQTFILKNREL